MIKVDAREFDGLARRLEAVSANYKTAQKRVLVSAQRATNTQVKRVITKSYELPQARVAEGVTISAVDFSTLSFTIVGKKKVIGLQNFKHRNNARAGVRVRVLKGSGYKAPSRAGNTRSKAFLLPKGQIAQRTGSRAKTNRKREAIEVLFGPSVADMLNRLAVNKAIAEFAVAKIGSELQRQITVALKKG